MQSEDWACWAFEAYSKKAGKMFLLDFQSSDKVRRLGNVLAELFRQGYSQKTGKCTC